MRIRGLQRVVVGLSTVAVTIGAVITSAAAEPAQGDVYVAVGDSFSAGSGISPNAGGVCGRSSVNYPTLVARQLGVGTFRDVTCGAAESTDFLQPQYDVGGVPTPPQLDALTRDTTLVTVGIGGNDVKLVELAAGCINALPEPNGQSCAARNTAGGIDVFGQRIEAFAPTYGTLIEEIKGRSPLATVVMVGYPTGIRPGGCPATQPAWAADADYLEAKIEQLNNAMASEAAEHGAVFADLEASSRGHDACAVDDPWMVGLIPRSLDAVVPFHPNAAGHRNAAAQVVAAIS